MFDAWSSPVVGNMFYPMVYTEDNNERMLQVLEQLVNNNITEISVNQFESILEEEDIDWSALDNNIQSQVVEQLDIN
jgi:hypothetical protein